MKKNGFTLVELIGVIAVLAILLVITVPSVRTYISNSYAQSYELDLKAMEEAAKAYVIDEKIKFEEVERKIVLITTLVEAGFLDPVIDPQNKEQCEGYVIVDRNYRKYIYKAYLKCGTNYESEGYGYTDNVFPEIFILGDNPVTIEVGSTYVDAGATASDNIDGDITSNILTTGEVNPNEIGTYTITYSVTDSSNNTTTKERIVNVIDTTAPNISFGTNGNSTWAKTRSTTVTVSDIGGVNTSSLKYLWNTSTSTPSEGSFSTTFTSGGTINSPVGVTGGYYLWILAKDTQGNTIISRTNVFNLDNTAPIITMNGDAQVNVYKGQEYIDAGATASDAHSGVGSVIPTGTVNVDVIGTYYIYYNVADNAGNAAVQVERSVIVSDPFEEHRAYMGTFTSTIVFEPSYNVLFPRIYALKAGGGVMIYQPDYPWTWYLSGAYSGYAMSNITGAKAITGYGATQVLAITENNAVIQYTCPKETATCTSSAMAGFGTNVLQLATTVVYEPSYNATFPRIYALKADGSVMIYQPDYPWTWYLSDAYSGYVTTNITGAKAITGYGATQVLGITENNEVVQYTCPRNTATCTSSAMAGFGTNVLQLATTAVYERTYSATFPRIYALKADGSVMIYQPDYPWTWYLSGAYSGYVTTNITGAKAITGYSGTQVLVMTENNEVVQYTCPKETATCTSSAMTGFGTIGR